MNYKKFLYGVIVLGSMSTSFTNSVFADVTNQTELSTTKATSGTVNIADWTKKINGTTITLTDYIGHSKDVVIPLSGDLKCTNVKITREALRHAAEVANTQYGTLATSSNDTSGLGLISDNSGDDNPDDSVVDYSETFANLAHIMKIDLSGWNVVAKNGQNGKSDAHDVIIIRHTECGENGENGESIQLSGLFRGDTELKRVSLTSLIGKAGNGGDGGDGSGINRYVESTDESYDGKGGNGGFAGNFDSSGLFEGCSCLTKIDLPVFQGVHGIGGNGGNGYGGNGRVGSSLMNYGGNGFGGKGYNGGKGIGGFSATNKNTGGGVPVIGSGQGGDAFGGQGGDGISGTGSYSIMSGDGNGGNSYGGNGGTGIGGQSGCSSNGGYGNGGNGYRSIKNNQGGIGGDGIGGANIAGSGYYEGHGIGGNGWERGRLGFQPGRIRKNPNNYKDGQIDKSLTVEACSQDIQDTYKKYTGTSNKTDMFCPIALPEKESSCFINDSYDYLSGVVLRDRNTGKDVTTDNLQKVQIAAKVTATGAAIALTELTKKEGTYTLTYNYDGVSADRQIEVKSRESVNVKDLTLLVGENWQPRDNFVTATDEEGKPLDFSQITVTGAENVDTKKTGSYEVTYSYQKTTEKAKVNIIDIELNALPIQGLNDPWSSYNGLKSVTGVDSIDHSDIPYFEKNVQVMAHVKGTSTPIDPSTLTNAPGVYTILYTYQGKSKSIDVVVEKKEFRDNSKIPTSLNFGTLPIQYQKDQTAVAKEADGTQTKGMFDVTDTRSADGEGFQLKVKQDSVLKGKTSGKELSKAKISFHVGTVTNTSNKKIFGGDQTVTLDTDNECTVLKAEKGQSRGETKTIFDGFQLLVPKEVSKTNDEYQTNITWTLSDTPE